VSDNEIVKSTLLLTLNLVTLNLTPVGKIAKKNSLKECGYVNLGLKIQCHVIKNTLTDGFFGDFAHCDELDKFLKRSISAKLTS